MEATKRVRNVREEQCDRLSTLTALFNPYRVHDRHRNATVANFGLTVGLEGCNKITNDFEMRETRTHCILYRI